MAHEVDMGISGVGKFKLDGGGKSVNKNYGYLSKHI